jgi:dTDP-glucose 4,6-dehydratase
MARILVTGGTGFIGSNLVPELRNRGHEVWVSDLMNTAATANYIRCDTREYRQIERIFFSHEFDFIYHLAAEYGRWNGEDYYENLWQTNVIGTKHMIRLQEQKNFKMIFFSSAEVYAITKWAGELMVLNSAVMFGTDTVRVRPVNAYGPHEHYHPYRGVIPAFTYKALHDEPYTVYLGHKRIFDYVEDTCRTLANIADNFIPGEVYNIGGKEEWECDIKHVSDLILGYLGKDDSRVTYKKGEPFTTQVKHIDYAKSRRDLKHDPRVPPEVGIPRTIDWMKSVYGFK